MSTTAHRRAVSTTHADVEHLRAYIELLAGGEPAGGMIEVRTRRPDRLSMRHWFIDIAARERLTTVLPTIAPRADVYLGIAPRHATAGSRDAITHAHVAWADVDGPDGAERLSAFTPLPSLVIASGSPGGAHAYWRLSRPAEVIVLEELNQRLAAALGGDPVWAATTILRPPATLNHKHDPPRPVHVIAERADGYDPDDLLASLAATTPHLVVAPPAGSRPARPVGGDCLLTIAPPVYVERLFGITVPRSGFISCPWHSDSKPSFKVYNTPERGWYCYGRCHAGGSIYDLAARHFGTGTRDDEFRGLRARLLALFPEICP